MHLSFFSIAKDARKAPSELLQQHAIAMYLPVNQEDISCYRRSRENHKARTKYTYELRPVSRAIIVQDTKDGAFVRLEGLRLRVRGSNEVLLAAAAYIGTDAILLILLVHPDCGHCSRRVLPCPSERISATLYLGYRGDLNRRRRHTGVHINRVKKKYFADKQRARARPAFSVCRDERRSGSRSLTVGCTLQSRGKTDGRSPRRSERFGCRLI